MWIFSVEGWGGGGGTASCGDIEDPRALLND